MPSLLLAWASAVRVRACQTLLSLPYYSSSPSQQIRKLEYGTGAKYNNKDALQCYLGHIFQMLAAAEISPHMATVVGGATVTLLPEYHPLITSRPHLNLLPIIRKFNSDVCKQLQHSYIGAVLYT
jgi:hypothetical protein